MLRNKKLVIKSKLSELHKLEEFVEQISDVYNINSNYYSNILVALNEAVTNSIVHGNKENENLDVEIAFVSKNKGLSFTVKDQGKASILKIIPILPILLSKIMKTLEEVYI